MTFPVETKLKPVILTQSAASAIRDVIEKRNLHGYALRVYITGGGCSSFQYAMALDSNIRPEDCMTEVDGIKLIVDEVSIRYLQGATVDYIEDLTNSGFKINNMNAVPTCGCGQSINLAEEQTDEGCTCS